MCETIHFLEKLFGYYLVFIYGYGFYMVTEDEWWIKKSSKTDRFFMFIMSPLLVPLFFIAWFTVLKLEKEAQNER